MALWHIENAGPEALILRFGERMDPQLLPVIRAATERLAALKEPAPGGDKPPAIRDLVPSYSTLLVCYDPVLNDFRSLSGQIRQCLRGLEQDLSDNRGGGRLVEIPVWYHPQVGPDLERVARHHGLSVEEVIRRHSQRDYPVYAIGFAPGFAYLGNLDPTLATPRLDSPRQTVPAGSVALAEQQTAVYPIATPGGWNLLGRTPMTLFDPDLEGLCPLSPGDTVRFVPISREQFLKAGGVEE
ncbi:MAG: 5-oxoprolinase subunit PxpB [Oleiphilaceae bacterium]|nr:5-oxoprolinase subunit PxpB [Oleiphilaceae bacterium]